MQKNLFVYDNVIHYVNGKGTHYEAMIRVIWKEQRGMNYK